MKDLFILRHAEAVLPTPELEDSARPLTTRGSEDAARLGAYWHDQGVQFNKVVASPAVRTAQTAYTATAPLGHTPQDVSLIGSLYEGSIEALHELLHAWNNSWQCVLLVSHLPVIQALITYLTNVPVPPLSPGGYAHLQLDLDWWRGLEAGIGQLVAKGHPADLQVADA